MAISKEKKEEVVSELKEMLTRTQAVVASDYRGLTAGQVAELRNRLRPLDSRFVVAKNSLIVRSLRELGLPTLDDILVGPTALTFVFGDWAQPLREMREFATETELLKVKGGLLGNRAIAAEDVHTLTHLPSLQVVQAETLTGLQSPISGLVGLLDGTLSAMLRVMDARVAQLGEAAG